MLAVLFLATIVRLAALPLPGTEDTWTWKMWMFAAQRDVTAVYGIGGDPPVRGVLEWLDMKTTVDYPPIALYELGLAGLAYRGIDPTFAESRALTAATKLPGFVFGLALTALFWWTVRRRTGSVSAADWIAAAYWANPATILNAEVLGYLDPLMLLPAIAALVLLHERLATAAGACLAIAMLTKPQALLLGPVFALAAWRVVGIGGAARAAAGFAAAAGLAVLPYAIAGALPNMWLAFGSFYARRDILSGNAANLWWIVTYVVRAWYQVPRVGFVAAYRAPVRRILQITTLREIGFPNPRPFGTFAIGLTTGWALWQLRLTRDLATHALGAAFVVHAFFVLGVGVHEHHMMLAVPLLALAAGLRATLRPLFWAISAIVALNMNLFYGIGYGVGWGVPRGLLLIDLSVLLAIANVAAVVWHGRVLAREVRATVSLSSPAPAAAAGSPR